jgi:O-antigen/teichoic acid export membrane protein
MPNKVETTVSENTTTTTGLRQKTVTGLIWVSLTKFGGQIINFLVVAVLARILTPYEFGLMAMVYILTNFASLYAELGLGAALIQKQNVTQELFSSVFWLNVSSGLALTTLFFLIAPGIALFFDEPLLVSLTRVIALTFVIRSFGIIHNIRLTKSLQFHKLTTVELVSASISGIFAITLAFAGLGIWVLPIQYITNTILATLLLWQVEKWSPSTTFSWEAIKKVRKFSGYHLGVSTLNYWTSNLDNLLIGRIIGASALGIYSRAYATMLIPLSNFSFIISKVLFPSLSLVQIDEEKLRSSFLEVSRLVGLITFPATIGLMVVAESFVLTIYGPNWVDVIVPLQILCIVAVTHSVVTLNRNIFLAQGYTDIQFKMALVLRFNQMTWIIIGLNWGIIGVATGYAFASVLNFFVNMSITGRLIHLSLTQMLRNLFPGFISALVMASMVWMLEPVSVGWPEWMKLLTQIILGSSLYFLIIHIFRLRSYQEAKILFFDNFSTKTRF